MSTADSAGPPFTMTLDGRGILRQVWNKGIAIDQSLARSSMDAANELCGVTRRPLLVDMATIVSCDRAARAVFGEPSVAGKIALLGRSSVDRLIANFVLAITKLPSPTRVFTDEAAAVAWLKAGSDGG